ncbi:barstar family protein [Nocardia sp. JW2]|uniref:barstar family protein n=1 Tax=Nocardia sp. JW2 TaxID=3450738 RepID=UPI003F421006
MSSTKGSAFDADRPWVHFRGKEDIESLAELTPAFSGIRVFSLDGAEMDSVDGLFGCYYSEFEFPPYFGSNWPAFEECLTTLDNLPSRRYLTIIHHAQNVLAGDRRDLKTYLRVLNSAGCYWANAPGIGREWGNEPVAFNTLFLSEKYSATELSLLIKGDHV